MSRFWPVLCGLICLLVSGCGLLSRSLEVSPWLPVLEPQTLGQSLAVTQKVSGERNGEHYVMLVQLEISTDRLVMVASTGAGNTLFSLDYRDGTLTADRSPLVPAQLDPAFVLADFQLTFWPVASVQAALAGSDYRMVEVARRRELFQGDELLVQIDYAAPDPWAGPVEFHNLRWQYRYRIDTVQVDSLQPAIQK